jgi:hypothetical protein
MTAAKHKYIFDGIRGESLVFSKKRYLNGT